MSQSLGTVRMARDMQNMEKYFLKGVERIVAWMGEGSTSKRVPNGSNGSEDRRGMAVQTNVHGCNFIKQEGAASIHKQKSNEAPLEALAGTS